MVIDQVKVYRVPRLSDWVPDLPCHLNVFQRTRISQNVWICSLHHRVPAALSRLHMLFVTAMKATHRMYAFARALATDRGR